LLVMPGGADIPYHEALQGAGNQNIKQFVESGGHYLGICAGGYYGGQKVEFDLGGPLEVNQNRELGFFPGVVQGPYIGPYSLKDCQSCRALPVSWEGALIHFPAPQKVYYNGGGVFVGAPSSMVLARYEPRAEVAMVLLPVGKGKVLLSGVHFEYSASLLTSSYDPLQREVAQDLLPYEKNRKALVRKLLQLLLSP